VGRGVEVGRHPAQYLLARRFPWRSRGLAPGSVREEAGRDRPRNGVLALDRSPPRGAPRPTSDRRFSDEASGILLKNRRRSVRLGRAGRRPCQRIERRGACAHRGLRLIARFAAAGQTNILIGRPGFVPGLSVQGTFGQGFARALVCRSFFGAGDDPKYHKRGVQYSGRSPGPFPF